MNYYNHHIGDFVRDTARLNDSQCMAYLRLLWVYYTDEKALENDINAIAFKIGANAQDVGLILNHFFFLHDDNLWHQARCDKEILTFRKKSDKAKDSANARWNNANAMRTHNERNANASVLDANQEPVTNNQEPKKNTKAIALPPEGVDVVVWDDFQKLRKTKKAPLTKTAIDRIEREGNKAGLNLNDTLVICCSRGWAGFEASWLDKKAVVQESFRERDQRLASERYQQAAGLSPKIIDIIPMELLA